MHYIHGGDIYHQKENILYDFSININPLGMPERSRQAAMRGIELSEGRYPDPDGKKLCTGLAQKKNIDASQIILGNGAAELIYALCQALRPPKGCILAPGFQEYEAGLKSVNAKLQIWDLQEKETFCLTRNFLSYLEKNAGKNEILFVCNPNNPTGSMVSQEMLRQIAAICEKAGCFLCVDECFLPFLENEKEFTMLPFLQEYPHLIVLRAFTKIYGMPGLRIGYACTANQKLLEKMHSVLQPWNTSVPAQMAAQEALEERAYLQNTIRLLERERTYLVEELSGKSGTVLADRVYPSAANYIFFHSRRDLKERLLENGILIRSCANYRNLSEGYFRIAIRTHEENAALVDAWKGGCGRWSSM